jgi:hypothetical protein
MAAISTEHPDAVLRNRPDKRSLVIHTLDADGATTREAELKSDRGAVLAYFGALAGPHRAVVECVQSWYWLRDLLAPSGVTSGSPTPSM